MNFITPSAYLGTSQFPDAEESRKKIVTLVFVIYWLLIFEGAFRKWIIPEYQQIVFFVRDPFVLLVYLYALKKRLFLNSILLVGTMTLSVLILPVMMLQVIADDVSPLVLAYGWRNYFLYIPLAFVIGKCFQAVDLAKLIKQSVFVAVPMSVLVFIQFISAPDAYINRGLSEDDFIFQVISGVVRTTGTFTFTTGYSYYASSMFALLLACWLKPEITRAFSKNYLLLASFATITLISLSGSRTVFFLVALSLLAVFVAAILAKKAEHKNRFFFVLGIMAVAGGLIFSLFFTDAFDALVERQADAFDTEGSTLVRAFSSFYTFLDVVSDSPILGYGIGFGTNGGTVLDTGTAFFRLAEDEWARTYLELGPLFALAYFVFRISLVVYLLKGAIRAAKRADDPLALLLLSFIGITLLNGQITMQGTVNGYGWLFCGFCLAAIKAAQKY